MDSKIVNNFIYLRGIEVYDSHYKWKPKKKH